MSAAKVALFTGATGFVGSQVARRLLDDGFEVRALTSGTERGRLGDAADRIRWFDLSAESMAMAARGATQFFNFAIAYDRAAHDEDFINEVNVEFPLRVIRALQHNDAPVACVLGDSFYRKFSPEATAQARYTRSKTALADRVALEDPLGACHFGMLLIEQVYGPGESLQKVYPRVARQLLDHAPRVPLTLGTQRRDFIHIHDVVSAAVLAGRGQWRGAIDIGCGSGESTPVRDVFEALRRIAGSPTTLGFGDIPPDQSIADSTADLSWLRSQGWDCTVQLEAGLTELVADVARQSNIEWTRP